MNANMFECNGNTLCVATIMSLECLLSHLDVRMEEQKRKAFGKRSDVYKALRRQYNVTRELIKIGRLPFTPKRIMRVYTLGIMSNELKPVPESE